MATDPNAIRRSAIAHEDVSELKSALQASRSSSSQEEHDDFLQRTLHLSVRAGTVPLTVHLLENEGASAQHVSHSDAAHASVDLLEILTRFGYDPDKPIPQSHADRGQRLIDNRDVLQNEAVVRWLVDYGVSLNHGQDQFLVVPRPPPLLDIAGQWASVSTFRFLRERGAKLGRRTLHLTVMLAAGIRADPSVPPDAAFLGYDPSKKGGISRKRMAEMLPYLVDELGLDVNANDLDGFDGEHEPPFHYGTPLGYAVYSDGAAVVKWLLSKGADPRIGDADMRLDAKSSAVAQTRHGDGRTVHCLAVFEEWEKSRASH